MFWYVWSIISLLILITMFVLVVLTYVEERNNSITIKKFSELTASKFHVVTQNQQDHLLINNAKHNQVQDMVKETKTSLENYLLDPYYLLQFPKPWRIVLYTDDKYMTKDHGYMTCYREPSQTHIEFIPGNINEPLLVDIHTIAVIFNHTKPNVSDFYKKNVCGISQEPKAFTVFSKENVDYINENCGMYLLSDASGLNSPFISHYQFIPSIRWDSITIPEKTALMSIMVSEKQILSGHKYRYELVKEILKQGLPIDIFGRGANTFKSDFPNDTRIKGEFQMDELYATYKFTIAVENNQEMNYISEKYVNAISYNTVPLYLGAPNISEIFGKDQYISLSGNLESDMVLLRNVCTSPDNYKLNLEYAQKQLQIGGKANLLTFLSSYYGIPLKL